METKLRGPSPNTSVRLDPNLKSIAEQAADHEGLRTLTAIITVALTEYLRRKGYKIGGIK